MRIAASLAIHVALLAGAVAWRGTPRPSPLLRRSVTVVLPQPLVPAKRAIPRAVPQLPLDPVRRSFELPRASVAPPAPGPPPGSQIEAPLPDAALAVVPPAPQLQVSSLPPPPIVVGKLGDVTAASLAGAVRGDVRTVGFGAATHAESAEPARALASARFGDATAAAPQATASPRVLLADATPVQILSKPSPAYTDEARRRRIEGEVLLEILFTAAGEARVLRVVRGLGHGLDENAVASASAIRFRPAERTGEAVDQIAKVHIVFRLAY